MRLSAWFLLCSAAFACVPSEPDESTDSSIDSGDPGTKPVEPVPDPDPNPEPVPEPVPEPQPEPEPVPERCGDGVVDPEEVCDEAEGNGSGEGHCLADCSGAQLCGDGNPQGTEECDEDNLAEEGCAYGRESCQVCDADCALVNGAVRLCGDGVVDPEETCDDGEVTGEGTCLASCAGDQICGNQRQEGTEGCDDGNRSTEPCSYGVASCQVCDADCAQVGGVVPRCGDGVVQEQREACDDGEHNGTGQGYCVTDCSGVQTCGDRSTQGTEACDDGNRDTESCSYGAASCEVCADDCTLTAGATARCGDSVTNAPREGCDEGELNGSGAGHCDADCARVERCGNGFVEGAELCDQGASNSNNGACKPDCTPERCGDGLVGPSEACDDGDADDRDGCSNSCTQNDCGNGVTDAGEQCDDGDFDDTNDCTNRCLSARCGDGFTWAEHEACDNGPLNSDVGACTSACVLARCGDNAVWALHEECDHGLQNSARNLCTDACRLNVCGDGKWHLDVEACDDGNEDSTDACVQCVAARCGDGFVWASTEECDAGGENSNQGACKADCTFSICGDGFVGPDEACDNGGQNADGAACTTQCRIAGCGDGFVGPGEQCDDGVGVNAVGATCNPNCTRNTCPDGVVLEGVEACDDGNQSATDTCLNNCRVARCGDSVVWTEVEQCDRGAFNSDLGACTSTCQNQRCGDAFVGPGEACDLGDGQNANIGTCTLACLNQRCGDGFVGPGEQCDLGDVVNADNAACISTCQNQRCGDGFVGLAEQCDDGDFDDTDGCHNDCTRAIFPPAAPLNVAVANVAGDDGGALALSWEIAAAEAGTDAVSGFRIYRDNGQGGGLARIATLVDAAALSYIDGSVSKETTYRYAVSAYGLATESALSTLAQGIASDELPPAAVTNLSVADPLEPDEGRHLLIRWTPSVSADVRTQTVELLQADGSFAAASVALAADATSWLWMSGTRNVSRTFRVVVHDGTHATASEPRAGAPIDELPPAAVTQLTTVEYPSCPGGEILIQWYYTAAPDAVDQTLYRCTSPDAAQCVNVATLGGYATSHYDDTVADNVTYYYKVAVSDGVHAPVHSVFVQGTLTWNQCAPRDPPLASIYDPIDNAERLDVNWEPASLIVTSYEVWRCAECDASTPMASYQRIAVSLSAERRGHSDNTVQRFTPYCYVVRAVNSVGSRDSAPVCGTPGDEIAPAPPAGGVGSVSDVPADEGGALVVRFPKSVSLDVATYLLERQDTDPVGDNIYRTIQSWNTSPGDGPYIADIYDAATGLATYTDQGLQRDHHYRYRAFTWDGANYSTHEIVGAAIAADNVAPLPVTDFVALAIVDSGERIRVSWTRSVSPDVATIALYVREGDGEERPLFNPVNQAQARAPYFEHSVQSDFLYRTNRVYTYRMRVSDGYNATDATVVGESRDNVPPHAPIGLALSEAGYDDAQWLYLSWSENYDDGDTYRVQRAPQGSTDWATLYEGPDRLYNDNSGTPGVTLCYRVFALDAVNVSDPSESLCLAPHDEQPPPQPSGLAVVDVAGDQGGFLSLQWNASSPETDVDHYELWRGGVLYQRIEKGPASRSYVDPTSFDVTPDARLTRIPGAYTYQLRAYDAAGNHSAVSASAVPHDNLTPAAPASAQAQVTAANRVRVSWAASPSSDVFRYRVYGRLVGTADFIEQEYADAPAVQLNLAPVPGRYEFRVTASDRNWGSGMPYGNESTPSNTSAAVDVWGWATLAAPPVGVTVTPQYVFTGTELIGLSSSGSFRYNVDAGTWSALPAQGAPSARSGFSLIWTSREVVVWGGYSGVDTPLGDGAAFDPTAGTWRALAANLANAPSAREQHRVIWTGDEMIVWGGCSSASPGATCSAANAQDGGAYNPSSDTWRTLAAAPTNTYKQRTGHVLVWTGQKMLLWGGSDGVVVNSGAIYDPRANTWSTMATANAPAAATGVAGFWTGRQLVVFPSSSAAVRSYDPAANTWDPDNTVRLALANDAAFSGSTMWGTEDVSISGWHTGIWNVALDAAILDDTTVLAASASTPGTGGTLGWARDRLYYLSSGQRSVFVPEVADTHDTWSLLTAAAPFIRSHAGTTWAGGKMVVWGGLNNDGSQAASGALYDLALQSWAPMNTDGALLARTGHSVTAMGDDVLILGGAQSHVSTSFARFFGGVDTEQPAIDIPDDAARYDSPTLTISAWVYRDCDSNGVYRRIVELGDYDRTFYVDSTLDRLWFRADYSTTDGAWRTTSSTVLGRDAWHHVAVTLNGPAASNNAVFYVDGVAVGTIATTPSGTLNPVSGTSTIGNRHNYTAPWKGALDEITIWNKVLSAAEVTELYGKGRAGQAASHSANANLVSYFQIGSSVATVDDSQPANLNGTRRCGADPCTTLAARTQSRSAFKDGVVFDVAGNSYAPLATTCSEPARDGHSATWTGSEVLVFGGYGIDYVMTSGRRYNPSTNAWSAMSTTGEPSARQNHTAVWTGTRLVIFGGEDASGTQRLSGGVYNPSADTWVASDSSGGPQNSKGLAAVSLGDGRVFFFGGAGSDDSSNLGYIFDPLFDANGRWTQVAAAPAALTSRYWASAVWTGSEVLIFGGFGSSVMRDESAAYDPAANSWRMLPKNRLTPLPRYRHSAIWTGTQMLIFGGSSGLVPNEPRSDGAAYTP